MMMKREKNKAVVLVGGNTRVFLFLSILWFSQSGDGDP
jgi:hypothetical protein